MGIWHKQSSTGTFVLAYVPGAVFFAVFRLTSHIAEHFCLNWRGPKGSRCIFVQGWQNVPQSSLRTRSYRGMELSKLFSNSNCFVKWSVLRAFSCGCFVPFMFMHQYLELHLELCKLRYRHKTKFCFRDAINSSYCRFRWIPFNSSSWVFIVLF